MLLAQNPASVDAGKNPISLLPNGSVLKGVLLPRYDEERRLVGDLKADILTLIDADRIRGENVLIQFYAKDGSVKGDVKLQNATFDQAGSLLFAEEPVEITNDNLVARGSGLVYAFQKGQGFLRGPASTWISSPETAATSMRMNPITKSALLAICLAPSITQAAPPKFVSEDELAAIKAEAESMRPLVDKINRSAQSQLAEDTDASEKASQAAISFIKASKIKTIATEKTQEPEEAAPLEVNPGPNDTVINCDGGMYFDAEEGVLVYLKNVRVKDPRFSLSGVDELKVFFDKKPETKKPKGDASGKPAGAVGNFGAVKKLIAEGAVVIKQKAVGDKEPVEASGRVLTYDIPSGEIVIHGGFPWVKQGGFFARAKQPDLTLRLSVDGSFATEGNWEMGGNLNFKNR